MIPEETALHDAEMQPTTMTVVQGEMIDIELAVEHTIVTVERFMSATMIVIDRFPEIEGAHLNAVLVTGREKEMGVGTEMQHWIAIVTVTVAVAVLMIMIESET